LTRRKYLGYGLVASGWLALGGSASSAQTASGSPLPVVTRSMLSITGAEISPERLQNATALFGVILDISKELRTIDLGEIEPAVAFTHEIKGLSRG
jgi:hypothetical protein